MKEEALHNSQLGLLCDTFNQLEFAGGAGSHSSVQGIVSRFSAPSLDGRNVRITSLTFSDDGAEVLVSYSTDHLYLFNVKVVSPSTICDALNSSQIYGTVRS